MSVPDNTVFQEDCKSTISKETVPNEDNILSLFKSRKRNQNGSSSKTPSFRKKEFGSIGSDPISSTSDNDPSWLEEELKRKELQNLLELRKLTKHKPRGLGALKANSKIEKNAVSPIESPYKIEVPKPKKDLMEAFTKQTNVMDVDKHMMSYIETKIQLLKNKDHSGETTSGESGETTDNDLPDHLKLGGKKPVAEGNLLLSASMLTAIPEVDLGLECRLKNIEETEMAKQALLGAQKTKLGNPAREPSKPKRFTGQVSSNEDLNFSIQLPQESKLISDKEAVARFKKRFRRQ